MLDDLTIREFVSSFLMRFLKSCSLHLHHYNSCYFHDHWLFSNLLLALTFHSRTRMKQKRRIWINNLHPLEFFFVPLGYVQNLTEKLIVWKLIRLVQISLNVSVLEVKTWKLAIQIRNVKSREWGHHEHQHAIHDEHWGMHQHEYFYHHSLTFLSPRFLWANRQVLRTKDGILTRTKYVS